MWETQYGNSNRESFNIMKGKNVLLVLSFRKLLCVSGIILKNDCVFCGLPLGRKIKNPTYKNV